MNSRLPDPATPVATNPSPVVVYACSGCSDAGELADRIARQLACEGIAQMSCLAGIGGRVKSLLSKAESAGRIFVIDGCPLACGKHTFELAGFKRFEHLGLQNIGLRKGSCSVDALNISRGVAAAKKIIAVPSPTADRHAAAQ